MPLPFDININRLCGLFAENLVNSLTERFLIIPCWRITEISWISSVKIQTCFNSPVTYLLNYFRAKFREILTSGSREIGVFPRKLFRVQSRLFFFTITAEIHALSLANFYCQYADRHMNLKFMRRVSEREPAIRQFVIVKSKLMSVFNASVPLLIMNFVITLSK